MYLADSQKMQKRYFTFQLRIYCPSEKNNFVQKYVLQANAYESF